MATSDFHPTPAMVSAVAEWHERRPDDRINRPLIPFLKERFNISNVEAIAILRDAPPPDERAALKERIIAAILHGGGVDAA